MLRKSHVLVDSFRAKPSQMLARSPYVINKHYNTLDFVPGKYSLHEKDESYLLRITKLWVAIFFVAISIGILGGLQSVALEKLTGAQHSFMKNLMVSEGVFGYFFWAAMVIAPTILTAAMIVYLEKNAKGLGLVRIIGFLNGIDMDDFKSIRVAAAKYVAIFFAAVGGLPGGWPEPFIHFGSAFSGCLYKLRFPFTQFRPFYTFSDAPSRRDLVTAGTASGVAVAFGAPIGAVLFCLEEGMTFWNSSLTYIMFVCTIISTFFLQLTRTICVPNENRTLEHFIFFQGISDVDLNFKFIEIVFFLVYGVIGAIIGSVWNELFLLWCVLQKKIVRNNLAKFLEAVVFSILLFFTKLLLFEITKKYCSRRKGGETEDLNVFCGDGSYESIGTFVFQDLRNGLKTILSTEEKGEVGILVPLLGLTYLLVTAIFLSATILPSGIIVPHIVAGATWGILIASNIPGVMMIKESGTRSLAKWALLGGLAQASGTARFTLSIGVILIESSGQKNYALPVFITVLTAKWIGAIVTEPIYRTIAYLKGFPIIRTSLLPMSSSFKAFDVMTGTVVTFPPSVRTDELLKVLKTDYHEDYPVLQNSKVLGVMGTNRILTLLETQNFKTPISIEDHHQLSRIFRINEGKDFTKLKKKIKNDEFELKEKAELKLETYMNLRPYIIPDNMSLRRIYAIFLTIGPRYLIVVNNNCEMVGIIKRKDIARFRRIELFLLVKTEVVSFQSFRTII